MNRGVWMATLAVLLLLAGVYLYIQPPESETPSTTTTISQTTSFRPATGEWLTYHVGNSRSGYVSAGSLGPVALKWKSAQLDGQVYAEPLAFGGSVFVATANNSVYSLNASTGAVLWKQNLGPPVGRTELPCGDIDPTGITGTPVIDPGRGLIYVVAFLDPPRHVLFALGTEDGSVRFQQLADAKGMNPVVQQQRAALSLADGYVYMPYGGLYGDCGDYHGWVVRATADGSGGTIAYQVPTSREGGVWAASGAAIDSSGNLYIATGNGASSSTFDHGNTVVELSPSLEELAYFAPSNWAQLNAADLDLGSVGPVLLANHTLFQVGKEGVGYLLNASSLGGIGGQLASMKLCGGAYGGLAYSQPYVFVPCTDGLAAVKIVGSSLRVAWMHAGFFAGPPIVIGSTVWTVDRTGVLHVLSLDGTELSALKVGSVDHFVTPSSDGSAVFVAGGDHLSAFALT